MESPGRRSLLIAPDKFRGTATAGRVGTTVESVATDLGWHATPMPLSDGGEGLLETFGGPDQTTVVSGPLGEPVAARWRRGGRVAVVESAS